jgi:hypothetical protein
MGMNMLQEKLKKNIKYRKLMEIFRDSKLYQIPLEKLKEEVMTNHSSRSIRHLIKYTDDTTVKLVDQVIKANITDQGMRSRLVEIMLQCKRSSSSLRKSIRLFKTYAMVRYDPYLKKFRTKQERASALDVCLAELYDFIDEADLVYDMSELVVKDIDAGGFSLQRTIAALNISFSKERNI